ncbi:MAG TPA: hypothetical protein VGS79_02350 [Puia sp.]|nr:hypothetical protein [Puia sp.]
MKKLIPTMFSFGLLCLVAACHKDHVAGTGTTTDSTTTGILNVHLLNSFNYWQDTGNIYVELIISEPGGKVLLDTVTLKGTPITASLHTNATRVDLTSVCYESFLKFYQAVTCKDVNPSNWTNDNLLSYQAPVGIRPAILPVDTIWYTNVPGENMALFSESPFGNVLTDLTRPTTIGFGYFYVPGNYAYMSIQSLLLYKFYQPQKATDTVDCTKMDTLSTASYPASSYYSFYSTWLDGYTDSSDLNSQLLLWISYLNAGTPVVSPLAYPTRNIQKYAMVAGFQHSPNEYANIYTAGSSVNTNFSYPDPNSYTITSSRNTNFNVTWNATKPSYYTCSWGDSAVLNYTIYASPDTTSLDPVALLTAQRSRMLQGQDLTKLKFGAFGFETVQGLDYPGYIDLCTDSNAVRQNHIASGIEYWRSF